MRRLRIVIDTDLHTSEVLKLLVPMNPQYLVFAEEELGDVKERPDTLPPGLRSATTVRRLALPAPSDDPQGRLARKVKKSNPRMRQLPGLVYDVTKRGSVLRLNVGKTAANLGVNLEQLRETPVPRGTAVYYLKSAIKAQERHKKAGRKARAGFTTVEGKSAN